MAVEIGTATGYLNLAAKLKTFLTTDTTLVAAGEEWTCNRDDGSDMLFQGPGLSGTEEIFIGLEYFSDVGSDLYSWDVASFLGYTTGNSFDEQPGRIVTRDAFLPLWLSNIPYWFIANGQRVVVIAKVSTTYQSMYLGKFLPYGTPGQYPYPVFWGAMNNVSTNKYSSTLASQRFFPAGFTNSTYLYLPSGTIAPVSSGVSSGIGTFQIWPFGTARASTTNVFGKMAPFDGGDVTLLPAIIRYGDQLNERALLGELDGIFYIHGTGQSSESIVTVDSVDYLVFQDGALSDRNNFAAVRLA